MAALFVSDVDGTLVDRKGRSSASTRVRLSALLARGLLIGDHETDSAVAYLEAAHADIAR